MSISAFFNRKAKALAVFLGGIASMGLLIPCTLLAVWICPEWYGLLAGIVLSIAAIPLHKRASKQKGSYFASFLLNSIANGFAVSAYYRCHAIPLNFRDMLLAVLPAAGVLLLTCLVLQQFGQTKKITLIAAAAVNLLLSITMVVFWIMRGDLFFSFGFFGSLISFFYLFVFGLTVHHDERSVYRDISFGSFGTFVLLAAVVAVILSEGEILDVGGGGDNKTAKK